MKNENKSSVGAVCVRCPSSFASRYELGSGGQFRFFSSPNGNGALPAVYLWGRLCLGIIFFAATNIVNGQTFDISTNSNWNGFRDAETVTTWDYQMSAGWYFWAGVGVAFTAFIVGWAVRTFKSFLLIDAN